MKLSDISIDQLRQIVRGNELSIGEDAESTLVLKAELLRREMLALQERIRDAGRQSKGGRS